MRAILIALGLLLSATTGQAQAPTAPAVLRRPAVLPAASITLAAAKKLILDGKDHIFTDPDSIRGAKIGPPFTCLSGTGNCICLELNGKNPYGGYSGLQLLGFRLTTESAASFGQMAETARGAICGKLMPFPELNGKLG